MTAILIILGIVFGMILISVCLWRFVIQPMLDRQFIDDIAYLEEVAEMKNEMSIVRPEPNPREFMQSISFLMNNLNVQREEGEIERQMDSTIVDTQERITNNEYRG